MFHSFTVHFGTILTRATNFRSSLSSSLPFVSFYPLLFPLTPTWLQQMSLLPRAWSCQRFLLFKGCVFCCSSQALTHRGSLNYWVPVNNVCGFLQHDLLKCLYMTAVVIQPFVNDFEIRINCISTLVREYGFLRFPSCTISHL